MTVDSAARFSAAKGSRLATGVRIAAGAAGVPLPGLRRPPRIPLAIGGLIAAAAALAAMFLLLMLMTLVGAGGFGSLGGLGGRSGTGEATDTPSALARKEIPPEYLSDYEQAGQKYYLDWAILAGIGKVECDHGRDPDPSCTKEGAVNSAGAGGPMQFLAGTWATYGVAPNGGTPDRWKPEDAIFGAANYLKASGAPGDYRKAIFAYNHAEWYVDEVESWAAKYRARSTSSTQPAQPIVAGGGSGAGGGAGSYGRVSGESPTPIEFIPGERAELDPADGHLAWIPEGAPTTVQAMIVAGNELQELPYGPGGHPDPLGASEEDCSSTVNYVLYRSGVRPLAEIEKDNPLAQDYVDWGDPGPGRWVTIYATDAPEPHVFIVIAGLRLDTSHNGTDVGPNKDEDGPRWRILSYTPTWAKWSVRHPPGL
ncbi:MAG TPA: lytic transglycosylase domain-containing protein [Solirubrobacteraceae bacterium]